MGFYMIFFQSPLAPRGPQIDRKAKPAIANYKSSIGFAFLGPLFLLLVSKPGSVFGRPSPMGILFGLQTFNPQPSIFWTWLDIKDLSDHPVQPYSWLPDRYLWWWRASRRDI